MVEQAEALDIEPTEETVEAVETDETEDILEAADVDEEEAEESEEEYVETEYNGKTYTVPVELKDALLRQDDYTRKTQGVAEQRREVEAMQQQLQQQAEMQQMNLQGYAQLTTIDQQLQEYSQVDWERFKNDDPIKANQAYMQFMELRDARDQTAKQLSQIEQQSVQQRQQQLKAMMDQGQQILSREIKDWSPEVAKTIAKTGVDEYGFSNEEISSVLDPRMVKVLYDAHQYRKMVAGATQKPKPSIKPTKKVAGRDKVKVKPEELPMEEYAEWWRKHKT